MNNSASNILVYVCPRPNLEDSPDWLYPHLPSPAPQPAFCSRESQMITVTLHLHHWFSKLPSKVGVGLHHSCHGRSANIQSANFYQQLSELEFQIQAWWVRWVGWTQPRSGQENSLPFLNLLHDFSEGRDFIKLLNKCHLWPNNGLSFLWGDS